jgi:hypothetical protein
MEKVSTSTFYILEGFGINQIKARIKALKELLKSIPKSI